MLTSPRSFPTAGYGGRRAQIAEDHSKILVLSIREGDRGNVLRCGEALSTVLLECTVAGLATCTLVTDVRGGSPSATSSANSLARAAFLNC